MNPKQPPAKLRDATMGAKLVVDANGEQLDHPRNDFIIRALAAFDDRTHQIAGPARAVATSSILRNPLQTAIRHAPIPSQPCSVTPRG